MRKSLLLALSVVGLFDSAYLWWAYTSPSRPIVCVGSGCDVVRASPFAYPWGIPMPVFGVAMYVVLALLIFAEPLAGEGWVRRIRHAFAGISTFGFAVSLYLTGVEAFVLHAWCTWCVLSAVACACIFALAILDVVRPQAAPEPAAALATLRRHFAVSATALLLGTPAFVYLSRSGSLPPAPPPVPATLLERLVRPDSHATGNPQAPVTVVEFADFQCPACSRAEETAREIRATYGARIRYVFRQFPLTRIHPQAEKAAEASECAAEQGKFWEALDKLYAAQSDLSENALKRYAGELGLDLNRFGQCLASGRMTPRVRRDLEDGRALGIDRTPTFFIDQKTFAGPMSVEQFSRAIEEALARRGVTVVRAAEPRGDFSSPQALSQPTNLRTSGPAGAAGPGLSTPSGNLGSAGVFSTFPGSAPGCSEQDAAKPQPTLIETREARQLFEANPKPLFVDVRTPKEFATERIPGALNLPPEEIEQRWSALPKNRTIVFYESGRSSGDVCAASRAAGRALLAHGFAPDHVKVYQDGLAGWEKAGLPIEH